MDAEELMESIQEKIDDLKDRLADVDWRDPKVLGGVALAVILLGVGIYFLFAGSGTPPAKIQVKLEGKPVAGAYVYALLEDGTTKTFGPTDSEGYVQVPGDVSIVGVKLPDGKMVRKTAFAAPGEISTLSLEGTFKKTVTFYVVGLSGRSATLHVIVEGNEAVQIQITDGMATVDFGKDIVITPSSKITFRITADGYEPWELNTDGKHLESVYDVTLVKKSGTDVPVGNLKIIVTKGDKPFTGRADLYDVTDTVAASAQITGGGAEVKGLAYGQYILKIFDENGTYVAKKQIIINSPENNVTIRLMTLQEALEQGLVKKVTTEDGRTVIVPANASEEDIAVIGGESESGASVETNGKSSGETNAPKGSNTILPEYNVETGEGLTVSGGNDVDFAIISETPTVPVRIYVMDEDGNPITDAVADINLGYTTATETPDSTGKIEFGLHEGQCADVSVSAPGYEDKNVHICSPDTETSVALKHAYITGDLQVSVQDYMGNPVSNVKVVVYHGHKAVGQPAYTDSSGAAYIHKLLTGNYVIRATKDGMSAEANVSIEADQLATAAITLYPGTATLRITITRNKAPVRGSITFWRLDTGEELKTADTGIDGKATVVVPAIIPIRYVATVGDVKIKGPIMRLAPGDSKSIDVSVPDLDIPGVKIVGVYDERGREIANLPIGSNFKIVAIVGTSSGGPITASTDDADDIVLNVEGDPEAIDNGYTTVTIAGHVSQYPIHNHAAITISAGDASKTINLPIGDLMECTGDFCYSVKLYYGNTPITDDFKLIAGQRIHAKATLMYRGKDTAHVTAEIRINKNGDSNTIVGADKDSWEPGDVEMGEIDFTAQEGPYTEVLRLTTSQRVKDHIIKRFVAAKKEKLKVVAVPKTLLKTDKTQNFKIGVMKEDSDVYFAPDGLTYTIYGVRYDGSVEQVRVLQNATSPADISLSSIGSYTGLKVHAEAGIYAGDADITLTNAAVKATPTRIALSDSKKSNKIRVYTIIDDDYTLRVHATVTKNSSCNIEFHVTPRDATLNAAEGMKKVELNVWYTGGDNCAKSVGGDVKLTVSNDAGETIYETSIPILATPKGSCLEISTPGDEIEGKMEGEFTVTVKNRCTDPISAKVTIKGEGLGGTDLKETGIFDPLTLTTNQTEILALDPSQSRPIKIHYKMSGRVQTVYSAKITIIASRADEDEADKDVVVYNTDVSNCLRINMDKEGGIDFGYSKARGAYVADVPITITIGRYCTINPDTVSFGVNGDLKKHVTVESWQLEDLKIDLYNKLRDRDPDNIVTESTTIELGATDTTPLYDHMAGKIRMSAVAKPLAGPKANKEEKVTAETGIYTEPKELSAELEGTYYFEGSKIVSKDCTVKIYVGGTELETEAFRKPLSGISVTRAYAEVQGVQGHDYDVNKGPITAQLNGSYVEISIPLNADRIGKIAAAGYKVHVAGTATLEDGNTINFEGILTSEVPADGWRPETPKDEEIAKEDDGHIACFHVVAPAYAEKVKVSTTKTGAHIKECDDCSNLDITEDDKTISVKSGARICVWVVLPATERDCSGLSSEQVVVKLTPICNKTPVEELSTKKTIEVKPYYQVMNALPANVDLDPFAADTYAKPEEEMAGGSIISTTAQSLACTLSSYTNKLYPISTVATIVSKMNERPEIFPESVELLVYNDGSCEHPDTKIRDACKSIKKAMKAMSEIYFAMCEWSRKNKKITINCESLGDVDGDYKNSWKALEDFIESSDVSDKTELTKQYVNNTILENKPDCTTLEDAFLKMKGNLQYGELPVVIRWNKANKAAYLVPKWHAGVLTIKKGDLKGDIRCKLNTEVPGILEEHKDQDEEIKYLVASPSDDATTLDKVVTCYLKKDGMNEKINIPDTPLAEIELDEDLAKTAQYNSSADAITVEVSEDSLPQSSTAEVTKETHKACYVTKEDPNGPYSNKDIYLVVSYDGSITAYVGQKPEVAACDNPIELTEATINDLTDTEIKLGYAAGPICNTGSVCKDGTATITEKPVVIVGWITDEDWDDDGGWLDSGHCGKKEALQVNTGSRTYTSEISRGKDDNGRRKREFGAIYVGGATKVEITPVGGGWQCWWSVWPIKVEQISVN